MRTKFLLLILFIYLFGQFESLSAANIKPVKSDPIVISSRVSINELVKYNNRTVKVTGKLRVVGSSRRIDLVLTIDSRIDLCLVFKTKKKWSNASRYRSQLVTKTGKLVVRHFLYNNPKYNHYKFFLCID